MARNVEADSIAPVVKRIEVPLDPPRAFALFTDRMREWWPTTAFSVSQSEAADVTVDGRVGGDLTEIAPDGARHVWGTITEWDHPTVVAFTWHPGRDGDSATQVEVTFEPTERGTQVTLVHRRWEVLGDRAADVRSNYESGWDAVLAPYIELAS